MTSKIVLENRDKERKFLLDPYQDWMEQQGVPIVTGFAVDLRQVEVAQWDRFGCQSAFVNVEGRGNFNSIILLSLDPRRNTTQVQHLFETVVYVIEGHGQTEIVGPDGKAIAFEWGPRSLFAIPPNVQYRHFNASATERARLACTVDAPLVFNVFRDEDYIFNNSHDFSYRLTNDIDFSGDGDMISHRPGRHMWVTNYVADLSSFQLQEWQARGAGGDNVTFILADGTIHSHVSEIPVGRYKKGHRHNAGAQIFPVTGFGYSLLWYEGDDEHTRIDWEHGWVYAPPDMMFHQHFNLSSRPSRYCAVAFGSLRYPVTVEMAEAILGVDVDVKQGGKQIEYLDEDPEIRRLYRRECERSGVDFRMEEYFAGAQ